jgi:hypothetical protein
VYLGVSMPFVLPRGQLRPCRFYLLRRKILDDQQRYTAVGNETGGNVLLVMRLLS